MKVENLEGETPVRLAECTTNGEVLRLLTQAEEAGGRSPTRNTDGTYFHFHTYCIYLFRILYARSTDVRDVYICTSPSLPLPSAFYFLFNPWDVCSAGVNGTWCIECLLPLFWH